MMNSTFTRSDRGSSLLLASEKSMLSDREQLFNARYITQETEADWNLIEVMGRSENLHNRFEYTEEKGLFHCILYYYVFLFTNEPYLVVLLGLSREMGFVALYSSDLIHNIKSESFS